jgi:hypothetical protein
MAHFAELDENNVVLRVIVVGNSDITDENGIEQEQLGIEFCQRLLGGNWKQTSYNANMRKNYAGIGYTYNSDLDAFVPIQPYPSWILNTDTARWQAPVPMPDDGKKYIWDENSGSWVEVQNGS